MRKLGLALSILAGAAIVLGGGFLLCLSWAFTPRGPSRGAQDPRLRPLGGRSFTIFENHYAGGEHPTFAVEPADTPQAGGDTLLQVTEWPVPVAVPCSPETPRA